MANVVNLVWWGRWDLDLNGYKPVLGRVASDHDSEVLIGLYNSENNAQPLSGAQKPLTSWQFVNESQGGHEKTTAFLIAHFPYFS